MASMERDAVLKQAEKLVRLGRLQPAIAEYARLLQDDPSDWAVLQTLADLHARAGSAPDAALAFTRLADHLWSEGFYPKAGALYKRVLKLEPGDEHARLQLAAIAEQQGLLADARAYLAAVVAQRVSRGNQEGAAEVAVRLARLEADGDTGAAAAAADPRLLLAVARMEFERGQGARGRAVLGRLLVQAPAARMELLPLVRDLAGRGFAQAAIDCADAVVELAVREQAWAVAVEALELSTAGDSGSPERLMRLVELCVDGDLHDRLDAAQGSLVDAWLRTGRADEAWAVAEDLVLRVPSDANRARACAALRALGEADPDGALERLLHPDEEGPGEPAVPAPEVRDQGPGVPVVDDWREVEMAVAGETGEPEATPEIDLTALLADLSAPVSPEAAVHQLPADDLDTVFGRLREAAEASAAAQADLESGLAHLAAGRLVEGVAALERAARVPPLRFEAASRLGQLFVERGDDARGIEWLERAAEAPAPDEGRGRAVLVSLADALERSGESARALAILIEAAVDAPDDATLAARIGRLTRAGTEG